MGNILRLFYYMVLGVTNEEKFLLESELVNPISYINENFFDKLKTRYDKAKVVAKDISQVAKDALEKLVDAAKQVSDFIQQIKNILSKQVKLILTQTKDKIKDKSLVKTGLLDVVGMFSVPFIAPVIKMVGFVATMIATYELIDAITRGYNQELTNI